MSDDTASTFLEAEIATQPDDWRRAQAKSDAFRALLPEPEERVAVVGCGTSFYMSQAYAGLRESKGEGLTDAWPASEHRLTRDYDRVVAITRSGSTTEIVDVLRQWGDKIPSTVITATAGSPVVDLAESIVMPHLGEQSVVQTRFATGTLALLRSHLGEDLSEVADQAQTILDADEAIVGPAATADQITFLGHGWTNGLANEAALKLRESAQFWTESYPMMEYRHGPLSISAPGRVVWAFGQPVTRLAEDVATTGAAFESSAVDPMADLLRVHRLCLVRARAAGLNPDQPRNPSRSIILTPEA